jgi:hypothetical protein
MGDHGRRDAEPVDPAILGVSEKYIPELLKHTRQPLELVRFPQERLTSKERRRDRSACRRQAFWGKADMGRPLPLAE